MKINFDKVEIFQDVAQTRCMVMSIRKDFSDLVYQRANGVSALNLALKIYNGDGTEDYDDAECEIIRNVSKLCTPAVIQAVEKLLTSEQ